MAALASAPCFQFQFQFLIRGPQPQPSKLLLGCGGGARPRCLLGGAAISTAPNPIHNSSFFQSFSSPTFTFQLHKTHNFSSEYHKPYATTCDISPGLEDRDTTATMEGISVASTTMEDGAIKMKINVSGDKSEAIFDSVFSKMVSAAQPIPGFRRVKGVGHVIWRSNCLCFDLIGVCCDEHLASTGKTPNIRRDILIQILGPSKVYKQVIKKIINSTVAEYVEKQKLKVTKDLRVEQSFEELESRFVPGEEFRFDASIDQLGGEE
ncbi:bacterial trigger factor [Thalictrum thalictroides]|uniref:Bacterial trigger factor n=1 Tax=Thalictrum thalictroides TaxID=46969 RepID=A0A7J6W5U1_THATH|nr:bacterial trigger factor [Thalictrum thalictroides]